MKRLYLYALTSLLVTSSVATGVTILGGSHNKNSTSTPSNNTSTSLAPSNEPYVDTPQVKFMNNILQAGNIDLDALFNIKYKESNIDLGFKGTVSYYDLSNIKAGGTLNVKYDSLDYNIDFTYIDSTLYASTTFINAKIDIPTFSEGIKAIIPLFSNKVKVPEDSELNKVLDINVDGLLGSLSSLTFVPSDEYAYKAEFALNDYISFNIYTDENYKTKKLELNEVKVNDVDINASINTKTHINKEKVKLPEDLAKYDDYTDVYNFVSSGYAIANQKQFNIDVTLDLANANNELIGLGGNVAFDLETMKFNVNSELAIKNHKFNVFTQYDKEKGVYFSLNNLFKGRLTNENISAINKIVEGYLDCDLLTYLQTKLKEITSSNDFESVKNHTYNEYLDVIKNISYKDNKIIVTLDASSILGNEASLVLTVLKTENVITEVEVENFVYQDYKGTLKLDLKSFNGIDALDDKDFENYEPILDIYDEIKLFTNQKEFGFNINNLTFVNNSYEPKKTYTITDGFVQFKLDEIETENGKVPNNSCYVDFTLNDGISDHRLVLDMRNEEARIMYKNRNEIYGKIKVGTVKEMIEQIMTLFKGDNPLFGQIAALIPSGDEAMLLQQFLKKDFTNLSLDLLKGFSVGEENTSITIDKKVLGLNEDITLNLGYNNKKITSLNIPNIAYKTLDVALTVSMSTYNEELALSDEHNYLDLNLLKIITSYGIPMMDYSKYKLTGQVDLKLHIGSLNLESFEIPLDVYIYNNNGKAEVKIDVKHIPTIDIFGVSAAGYHSRLEGDLYSKAGNGTYKTLSQISRQASNKNDRHATIVIKDDYIYMERSETGLFYKSGVSFSAGAEEVYTRSVKVTTEEFVNNIYQYLLSDLLGFSSTLCNTIIDSTGDGNDVENMQFDKLINDLSYVEESKSLNIGLDMSAITGNDAISNTKVSIIHSGDSEKLFLKEFKLSMDIASMIDVNATLSVAEDGMGNDVFDNNLINDYCNNYAYGDGRYSSHSNSKKK